MDAFMNTSRPVAPSPAIARYWPELKDLSDKTKLELIVLLRSSMTHAEEDSPVKRKGWASRFSGVWKDSRSAEEIVADIHAARTDNTFQANL